MRKPNWEHELLDPPVAQEPTRKVPAWVLPVGIGFAMVGVTGMLIALGGRPDSITGAEQRQASEKSQPTSHRASFDIESTPRSQTQPARDAHAIELERRLREDITPLLDQYCFSCHGNGESEGKVTLDEDVTIEAIIENEDDWQAVHDMLRDQLMPPEDELQPNQHQVLTIQQWIDDALDYYPPNAEPDPGWFTIHRLNKSEYRNTLRDLLGIDPAEHDIAEGLLPDDMGYGFDNIADVLSMSPLQLEHYLDAAERAIELGLGAPVEVNEEPVRLRDLEMEGGGSELDRGGYHLYARGTVSGHYNFPVDGEYEITIEAWGDQVGDEPAKGSLAIDGDEMEVVDVPATRRDPGSYTVRVRVEAGRREIGITFINDIYRENVYDRNLAIAWMGVAGPMNVVAERPAMYDAVFFVMPNADDEGHRLEGAEGSRRITQSSAARQIIERFASRAFRRPIERSETAALLGLYREAMQAGDSYEDAVKLSLTAVLVSPHFLYRAVENPRPNDEDHTYALSDYELASRLSFFLWSSTPDDHLLDLAEAGRLGDEEVLRGEVQRMLADEKSQALVENFAGQWLLLRNLDSVMIDRDQYAHYDDDLREAMRTEAELFFGDVLRSGQPVSAFIDSDYTFLNQRLAEHYSIRAVRGDHFRKVTLDADSPRGGVLTMAATLTVTSNPTRTSPVKRGQYVLEQLLGTPPPPPPPDVPPLEQTARVMREDATLREQLAAHLADPNCAICHVRMDPIGLSMEHFDATGAWRENDGELAIDAMGELPGGIVFDGSTELKAILLDDQALIVENLSEKMLTYALGRGLEPFDRPTSHSIVEQTRDGGDKLSAMIEAIVLSDAFRTCRGREVNDE